MAVACLLKHPELAKPRPSILSVERPSAPRAGKPVQIAAQVAQEVPVEAVLLYYAVGRGVPFQRTEMKAEPAEPGAKPGARRYSAAIPAVPAGADVYYYAEARAEKSIGTTTFNPGERSWERFTTVWDLKRTGRWHVGRWRVVVGAWRVEAWWKLGRKCVWQVRDPLTIRHPSPATRHPPSVTRHPPTTYHLPWRNRDAST